MLDEKYEGNQSQLAAALGVTRALISIVLREVQPPTKNLMARIGSIPGINPRWAADGEGDQFKPDTTGTLPVSSVVLPGPPTTCPHLLTGARHLLPDSLYQVTRYWLELPVSSPLIGIAEWKLAAGDLLLTETSLEWTHRLDLILGKLCGVRLRRNPLNPVEIGRLETVGDNIVLRLGVIVLGTLQVPASPPAPVQKPPSGFGERVRRSVLSREKEDERAIERQRQREEEQAARDTAGCPFAIDDIVAVCLYMARPIPVAV
ncbi:MAG: hypothetical protein K8U57_00230 [Planctomycetes bacterium]|nr:hypothetical protein [Planctomycetota bacterium]